MHLHGKSWKNIQIDACIGLLKTTEWPVENFRKIWHEHEKTQSFLIIHLSQQQFDELKMTVIASFSPSQWRSYEWNWVIKREGLMNHRKEPHSAADMSTVCPCEHPKSHCADRPFNKTGFSAFLGKFDNLLTLNRKVNSWNAACSPQKYKL